MRADVVSPCIVQDKKKSFIFHWCQSELENLQLNSANFRILPVNFAATTNL
jgi:hypothetical protein